MRQNDTDWIAAEKYFDDIEDCSPDGGKTLHTYLARLKGSENGCQVILKEIDKRRAEIYRSLCDVWNPHLSNVFNVYKMQEPFESPDGTWKEKYMAVTEFAYGQMLDCDDPYDSYLRNAGTRNEDGRYCLNEREAVSLCIQLCEGLEPLHKRKILHEDIKPENLIICRRGTNCPELKIIDFGVSNTFVPQNEFATSIGGTRYFRAPESYDNRASYRSDIYSVGVVLNYMLTGAIPRVKKYKGKNIALREIIEKTTASEASMRYRNIWILEGTLKNAIGADVIDRIPIIRGLPGFRSHRPARYLTATFVYMFAVLFIYEEWHMTTISETWIAWWWWVVIPIMFYGNVFHFQYFLPRRLKESRVLQMILYASVGVICFLVPVVYLARFL